jgi:hypothetical protein
MAVSFGRWISGTGSSFWSRERKSVVSTTRTETAARQRFAHAPASRHCVALPPTLAPSQFWAQSSPFATVPADVGTPALRSAHVRGATRHTGSRTWKAGARMAPAERRILQQQSAAATDLLHVVVSIHDSSLCPAATLGEHGSGSLQARGLGSNTVARRQGGDLIRSVIRFGMRPAKAMPNAVSAGFHVVARRASREPVQPCNRSVDGARDGSSMGAVDARSYNRSTGQMAPSAGPPCHYRATSHARRCHTMPIDEQHFRKSGPLYAHHKGSWIGLGNLCSIP